MMPPLPKDLPETPEGVLSGPQLEKAVAYVRDWYVNMRIKGVQSLSTPYPYGSVPITPEEQYSNYTRLQAADWNAMRAALTRLYQGKPDAVTIVDQEILKYRARMEEYGRTHRQTLNRGIPNDQPLR